MNSEYGQSSSKENSVEQRKPMEELKRMNQPSSAPPSAPQPIQPIVIQCDLPQAMDKLTEQADGINWELEEIRKTLPELKPHIDLTPVQQSLAEMQRSLTEMNKLLERVGNLSEKYSSKWIDWLPDFSLLVALKWIMLALIAVIIAAILLLPSCGSRGGKAEADTESTTLVKAGDKAPDFTVEMFDGTKTSLAELKGKVVLLNFWATWCPPCRQELTRVQKDIIDRFAGRNFVFLPISRGEKREDVAAFREKTGYTFPMGLDPSQAIYDRYASNYIPRNFLIGADGKVVLATVGYDAEEFDEMIKTIEKILE